MSYQQRQCLVIGISISDKVEMRQNVTKTLNNLLLEPVENDSKIFKQVVIKYVVQTLSFKMQEDSKAELVLMSIYDIFKNTNNPIGHSNV